VFIIFDGATSTSGAGGRGYWYDIIDVIGSEVLGILTVGSAKFQRVVFENCVASSPTAINGVIVIGFKYKDDPASRT
jgi:hypothetical protein